MWPPGNQHTALIWEDKTFLSTPAPASHTGNSGHLLHWCPSGDWKPATESHSTKCQNPVETPSLLDSPLEPAVSMFEVLIAPAHSAVILVESFSQVFLPRHPLWRGHPPPPPPPPRCFISSMPRKEFAPLNPCWMVTAGEYGHG